MLKREMRDTRDTPISDVLTNDVGLDNGSQHQNGE